MATVVLDDEPVIAAWLERRRALGQSGRDEVWVLDPVGHMVRIWQRDDEAYDWP